MPLVDPDAPIRSLKPVAFRFAAYTAFLWLGLASLPWWVREGDILIFKEGGPIEWLQFGLLATACAILLVGAARIRPFREVLLLAALFAAFACVREMDSIFHAFIPVLGWKLPAAIMAIAAGAVAWRRRQRLVRQLRAFVACRGFALLWSGFVVAVVLAQLVGHGNFLQLVMGDDYVRDYKRVIEELGELFGYFLLVIGSIESALEAAASSAEV